MAVLSGPYLPLSYGWRWRRKSFGVGAAQPTRNEQGKWEPLSDEEQNLREADIWSAYGTGKKKRRKSA